MLSVAAQVKLTEEEVILPAVKFFENLGATLSTYAVVVVVDCCVVVVVSAAATVEFVLGIVVVVVVTGMIKSISHSKLLLNPERSIIEPRTTPLSLVPSKNTGFITFPA